MHSIADELTSNRCGEHRTRARHRAGRQRWQSALRGALIAFATVAIAAPAAAGRYETLDDLFYRVAAQAEGFAGAYYTKDGALTIVVKPEGKSITSSERKRAPGPHVSSRRT